MAIHWFENSPEPLIQKYDFESMRQGKNGSQALYIISQHTQDQQFTYLSIEKHARALDIEMLAPSIYILHELIKKNGKKILRRFNGNTLRTKLGEISSTNRNCDAIVAATENIHIDSLGNRKNLTILKKLYSRYFEQRMN